jgi:hypothetical protein
MSTRCVWYSARVSTQDRQNRPKRSYFTPDIDRAASSPDRADALVWALAELMIAPLASFGIYELYRQMAEEQTTRETARIAAPDPRPRRESNFGREIALRGADSEPAADAGRGCRARRGD